MPARKPFSCPHCDATVPARALACPECGSDAGSGWSEDAETWTTDLPVGYGEDEDFDYDETLRDEGLLPGAPLSRRVLRHRRIAAMAVFLVICLLLWLALR